MVRTTAVSTGSTLPETTLQRNCHLPRNINGVNALSRHFSKNIVTDLSSKLLQTIPNSSYDGVVTEPKLVFESKRLKVYASTKGSRNDFTFVIHDDQDTKVKEITLTAEEINGASVGTIWRYSVDDGSGNYVVVTKSADGALLVQLFAMDGTLISTSSISL